MRLADFKPLDIDKTTKMNVHEALFALEYLHDKNKYEESLYKKH